MKFERFKELADVAINEAQDRQEWIDRIPQEISAAFFDNDYVTSLEREVAIYLAQAVGTNLYEEIMWYIYDYSLGDKIYKGAISWTINSREDFYSYLQDEYEFDE